MLILWACLLVTALTAESRTLGVPGDTLSKELGAPEDVLPKPPPDEDDYDLEYVLDDYYDKLVDDLELVRVEVEDEDKTEEEISQQKNLVDYDYLSDMAPEPEVPEKKEIKVRF